MLTVHNPKNSNLISAHLILDENSKRRLYSYQRIQYNKLDSSHSRQGLELQLIQVYEWAGPDSDRRPSARQADVLTKLDDRPTTILAMTRFHCSKYLWVLRSGAGETVRNSQKTIDLEGASDLKNSNYLKREGDRQIA